MTTKNINMDLYAKNKKYAYMVDCRDVNYGDTQYKKPSIKFYELWKYDNHYSKGYSKFEFEYQTHKENDIWKPCYGGSITGCQMDNVSDINKIVQACNLKKRELNIYGGDEYRNMITALRASGYKEAHDDGAYITWLD